MKNDSDTKIKCLQSDKSGEFTSDEFVDYCEKYGIKRQYATSRTPQNNGLVERKNQTMKEMERTMLDESKVPNMYWKETVQTTMYILNMTQLRVKTKYTPSELWYGNPTSIKHFRIFLC